MTTTAIDGVDLRAVDLNGQIHEDVLNRIIDASPTDTPFLSAIGNSTISNDLFEWTMERLASPVIDAQVQDGSVGRSDQSTTGIRVRNYSEIRTKTIRTSTRSNELNTIGFARTLVRQLNRRGLELKRDINATMLSNNASVAPATGTAPQTAGLMAWLDPHTLVNGSSGVAASYTNNNLVWDAQTAAASTVDGGWKASTAGIIPSRDINVALGALTLTAIRTVANQVWQLGANPTKLHARPDVIAALSNFMFDSSARIATLQAYESDDSGPRKAVGATNEFLTDFGVSLSFVPDRQMNIMTDGTHTGDTVFIYDPDCVEVATLMGMRAKVLSSDGLVDNRELQCDQGLKVLDWHGIGGIFNVDSTAAVTA